MLCISINHFEVLGYRAGFVEEWTTGDKMGPDTGFSLTFVSFPEQTKEIAVDEELLTAQYGSNSAEDATDKTAITNRSLRHTPYMDSRSTGAYLFNVYCVYSTTQPLSSADN